MSKEYQEKHIQDQIDEIINYVEEYKTKSRIDSYDDCVIDYKIMYRRRVRIKIGICFKTTKKDHSS